MTPKTKTPSKSPETEAVTGDTQPSAFESKLEPGPARFLAHVIEHAFSIGRRNADDFVRHFSPAQIMAGLELRPNLRADILEPTTGTRRKIGLRKSSASAGEDLQIAIDEGEATANQVVELFRPDDRVKYLDSKDIWSFLVEGEFWRADAKNAEAFERAKTHVAFILDRALTDGLLSHADLIDGVSVESLAQSLPRETLAEIIMASLERGRSGKAFTEKDLLETAAARILVEDVSLAHIWETVVLPKIARAHGLVNAPAIIVEDGKKAQAAAQNGENGKRKARESWSVSGTMDSKADSSSKPTNKSSEKKKSEKKSVKVAKTAKADDLSDINDAIEELEVEDFDIEEEEFEPSAPN